MSVCFITYAPIVGWKSQNGEKTLVNLGAGKKLTCFDPLRKGCHDFFYFFLRTIGPAHHILSILPKRKHLVPLGIFKKKNFFFE